MATAKRRKERSRKSYRKNQMTFDTFARISARYAFGSERNKHIHWS